MAKKDSKQIAWEVFKEIEPLWKKQPNTIYAIRVVMPEFKHDINVFFEWNKIGRATISREVASYNPGNVDAVMDAVEVLKIKYNLTVNLYK
ncbi:hypothetical protein LQZ24_05905 [Fructobacillus sp. M1-13]|uniref:Phage protein n=1 Tax=Fructobacillus papyriferae TaxID=2713171 RepID=A0ABS5QP96_9LACO|nr:hypothetical protein [Fructobacillus papyriferae]MBS9334984.1 hypothetical protein [Fructobacillus papyriferae]MCD2159530.1 hypothetical protein [Fructobacillus papyriferae]